MMLNDNLRGAGWMVASMLAFAINDALIKSLGGVLPVFQTLTLRGGMTMVMLGVFVWYSGWTAGKLSTKERALIGVRALTEIGAAYFIVSALFNMELANLTAILQILPLSVPLAAHLFLSEPLGWRRMLAIMVGFGGMIMIVQPGANGFNYYSLYGVAAVVCVTGRDIIARELSGRISPSVLSLFVAIAVFVFASIASSFEPWQPVPSTAWLALCGSSISIMIGYMVSVSAIRHGDVSFTAQFRYAGLIAALGLGYFFFDEWPNSLTLIGAGVVVAMGLFSLYRERVIQQR